MPSPEFKLPARTFTPLPLGTVLPLGWLKEQLTIQKNGLSGNLEEIWPLVGPDSAWLGGKGESWEIAPYYLDGLVPMAFLLNDNALKKKAAKWIDWTLAHAGSDGWIGPKTDNEDKWWPRAVMLKVLAQYAEATGDQRIEGIMMAYFMHLFKRLPEDPLKVWAKFRWGEHLVSLLWLCGRRACPVMDKLAFALREQGYDWSDHFTYFKIEHPVAANPTLASHVVNHAMAIKYPGLWSLFSGAQGDRQAVDLAIAALDSFHGQATGVFTGDEHLAGRNPSRGTELCAVVEYMFSLETLLSLFGTASYGDRLESLCYNALPATFTADMWAHQYDQQANQVLCTIDKRPWTNSAEANIFGLEPHYRCCTANFNQGWPKFIASMWMGVPSGGLAAVALGPSAVTADIAGTSVTVEVRTDYPFGSMLEFEVRPSKPTTFPLMIRIPAWAEGATLSIGKESPRPVAPGAFATVSRTWKRETVVVTLPMKPRVSRGFNDSATIHRGPLTYALKIDAEWKAIRGKKPAQDFEVRPLSKWNYALVLDPANPGKNLSVAEKGVKMPCFSEDRAPVVMTAKARELPSWGLDGASASPPPQSPVATSSPVKDVTLIPYGSAKLRITEFPLAEG